MLEKANEIRNQEGIYQLLKRGALNLSIGIRSFIRYRLMRIPLINDVLFRLSKKELKQQMANEDRLVDIISTLDHVAVSPNEIDEREWIEGKSERSGLSHIKGDYAGFGPYSSIEMEQDRESIMQLARTVKRHTPSTMLEIGTAWGGSLYVWARYLNSLNKIMSVDINFNSRDDLYKLFNQDIDWQFIEGDSHSNSVKTTVSNATEGEGIDFLYIDADHSYEGVKSDFEYYSSLVSKGGLIGLHDINHPGTGVPQLWEEVKQKYNTEEFGDSVVKNGLVYI
jgi:cephalosporin hydroxylase